MKIFLILLLLIPNICFAQYGQGPFGDNGGQSNLGLKKGTYVDGSVCTYTASGTVLNCNTTPTGTGTVTSVATSNGLTGGTITGAGTISGVNAAADGSTKGVVALNSTDFSCTSGVCDTTLGLIKGTFTNGDICTYTSSGTLLNCTTGTTGSGNAVLATSPTLVTPVLGTPTSVTLTNGTGLPESGVTSLVASGKTFTANNSITIAGTDSTTMTFPSTSATIARTDAANTFTGHQTIEGVATTGATGTGNLVFATSPTLVTPVLGTPTSGVATNLTGTASGLTAGTVTTNANLTGPVTSVGNATSITANGIQSAGINWANVNLLTPISSGGINWYNVNGLTPINSGGINWQNINSLKPINSGGVNWQSISNYLTGNVLQATSNGGVNWNAAGALGSVTNIATTAPIAGGPITTTGTISCNVASSSQTGCLASSDFTTFNNKQVNLSLTPGTYTNGGLCFYNTGGVLNCTASANGTGSVTTVSVVTANGISGSVANPTTTPAITLTPDLYSSGINWQDINLFKTITTGINWQALPKIVQTYNLNWYDINRISNLNSTGINWASINSLATINAGGLNWQNINLAGMLNMSGINWADARNQITGINWYQANVTTKTLSTAGAGVGNLKLYDSSGINWSDIQAASTINAPYTWTWPSADGTNGQVLTTNGSGLLSFSAAGSGAGTVNSGTQYQMAYYAANGTAVSGSNIYYQSGNMSIGESTLFNYPLTISASSGNNELMISTQADGAFSGGEFDFQQDDGSATASGARLFNMEIFSTSDGSHTQEEAAKISGFADQAVTSSHAGAYLIFATTPDNTVGAVERLRITNSGGVTMANASAHAGQATCWTTGGAIGYCTSVVGAGGACTCTGL